MRLNALLRANAAQVTRFGSVTLSELHIAPGPTGRRTAAPSAGGADALHLVFVLNGDVQITDRAAPLHLTPHDWALGCGSAVALCAREDADAIVMTIAGSLPSARHEALRCPAIGTGAVLLASVRSALQVADDLSQEARAALGRTLDELARLAIREHAASPARLSRQGLMRERVKAFVRQHLQDSSLSIDDIAQTFNCTKRYLHKVFSDDERSLNQYIWDLRLDRCSQDLANAELRDRSITEIAYVWGFRSPPHFSRAFRQRFGATPSVYRARQGVRRAAAEALPLPPRLVAARLAPGATRL